MLRLYVSKGADEVAAEVGDFFGEGVRKGAEIGSVA